MLLCSGRLGDRFCREASIVSVHPPIGCQGITSRPPCVAALSGFNCKSLLYCLAAILSSSVFCRRSSGMKWGFYLDMVLGVALWRFSARNWLLPLFLLWQYRRVYLRGGERLDSAVTGTIRTLCSRLIYFPGEVFVIFFSGRRSLLD